MSSFRRAPTVGAGGLGAPKVPVVNNSILKTLQQTEMVGGGKAVLPAGMCSLTSLHLSLFNVNFGSSYAWSLLGFDVTP